MNNAIFVAFNDRHWDYAQACLNSIRKNYPTYPHLIVFYNGTDDQRIDWLNSFDRVTLYNNYPLPKCIENPVFHKDVQSEMVYYKYLLWTDMFNDYGNILHLDVDTIILSSLDEIFNTDKFFIIKNNLYFREIKILSHIDKKVIDNLHKFDIDEPTKYDMANAGVFVIPRRYRTNRLKRSLIYITNDFKSYLKYADQSAISLWCMRHVIELSEKYEYNYQIPLYNKLFMPRYKKKLSPGALWSLKKDILDNIKIIHFSGRYKPTSKEFLKWRLMGRYSSIFRDCFIEYQD